MDFCLGGFKEWIFVGGPLRIIEGYDASNATLVWYRPCPVTLAKGKLRGKDCWKNGTLITFSNRYAHREYLSLVFCWGLCSAPDTPGYIVPVLCNSRNLCHSKVRLMILGVF